MHTPLYNFSRGVSISANHIVMLCYDAWCFHNDVTCLNDKNLASYQKCKAVTFFFFFFTWEKKPLSVHIENFPSRKWQQTNLIQSIPQVCNYEKTKKFKGLEAGIEAEDAFIELCITPYNETTEIYNEQQDCKLNNILEVLETSRTFPKTRTFFL